MKQSTERRWLSELPDGCQVCGKPFGTHFADAKTVYGPWALVCTECLESCCLGLGTGLGQLYNTETKIKVRG